MQTLKDCLDRVWWHATPPGASSALAQRALVDADRVVSSMASATEATLSVTVGEAARGRDVEAMAGTARGRGVRMEVWPQTASDVRLQALDALAGAGLSGIVVALEGVEATTHDAVRGRSGDFASARRLLEAASVAGIRVEVRTTLHPANLECLGDLCAEVKRIGAARWVVGPTVGAQASVPLEAIEPAMRGLAGVAARCGLEVRSTYAPFFARICERMGLRGGPLYDERRSVTITAWGQVVPDPAVDVVLGDVREHDVAELCTGHAFLRAMRDPDAIEGKCGTCPYRVRCGGSRARAFVESGSSFASDPACSFEG
jgi:radical SAM protein with 4Fe4S-binding SPASM domain